MPRRIESSTTWSSNLKLNLAMLSYSTGLTIPRIASPWFLKTKIGILLLIPLQLFVTFIVTIPCLFMELALGQYSNKATIKVWDLCPLLRGVGICSFMSFLLYQIYYTFLCTCTLCFTVLSIVNEPDWKSCNKSWNKMNCFTLRDNYTRRIECQQKYSKDKCDKMQWQSSVEQYYFNRILNLDETSNYMGTPQQELLLYSLATILLIYFANYGGPKSTEKFLIALAIVPTLQLIILFFTPLTHYNGFVTLNNLFTQFDKTRLADRQVWATIIDLSLSSPGLGFGAYVTLGTHSSFRNPVHFKVIGLSLVSVLFTFLYSITLHNFLVSLCLQSKMLMDDFFTLDQHLAMPDAVFFLEHSSGFWMSMWLSNCYMLGLRSLIVMMTINTEVVYNSLPKARRHHNFFLFIFCAVIYAGGIVLSTRIGYLVVKAIERALNDFVLLFLNTLNLTGVVYFYGIRTFRDDIHFMLGIKSSPFWSALFIFDSILLGLVLVYNLYEFYNSAIAFVWVYNFENFVLWFGVAVVLLYGVFHLIQVYFRKESKVFKPTSDWTPRYKTLTQSRIMFRSYHMAKEYLYRQERFRQQFDESEV